MIVQVKYEKERANTNPQKFAVEEKLTIFSNTVFRDCRIIMLAAER